MQEFEKKDFAKILKKNALDGHRWMKSTDSSAVRVYDRNLGAFPVTIDLYSGYARVVDYSDGGMSDDDITVMMDLISRFLYVEKSRIVYLERKKREGREQHGVSARVVKLNQIAPLDFDLLAPALAGTDTLVVAEDAFGAGCVGQRAAAILAEGGAAVRHLILRNLGKTFQPEGTVPQLQHRAGIDAEGIARAVLEAGI